VLFIGDGMGPNQMQLAQWVEYGLNVNSSLYNFPYQNFVNTYNIDSATTDSAAGATAIATGTRTSNGAIGQSWYGTNLTSILEIAQSHGYATGLVVTCHLAHATPAGFSAHASSRGDFLEIAADQVTHNIDVLLGGGSDDDYFGTFLPSMQTAGYTYVTNRTALAAVITTPVIGLFNESYLPKELDRTEDSSVPTLEQMTLKAIQLLKATNKSYFLMVEGSQIDSGGHAHDKYYNAHETIAFEKAVASVKTIAESDSNLLMLVTADHETGSLQLKSQTLQSPLPSSSDNVTTLIAKRNARINEIDCSYSDGHSSTKVILTGMGPYADRILTAGHHIDTFSIMRMAIEQKVGPVEASNSDTYRILLWVGVGIVGLIALTGFIVLSKKVIPKIKAKRLAKGKQ
jgi:alkaline phosphatase